VIDDREEVWDEVSRPALIKVEAFVTFNANGTPKPIRTDRDPRGAEVPRPDPSLMDVLRVLKHVHLDWVQGTFASCADAWQAFRQSVLDGVHLVFSGGLIQNAHNHEKEALWRRAEKHGAKCYILWHSDEPITHVVSGRNSKTVGRALENGLHAVNDQWLIDSTNRWQRQQEDVYAVQPTAISTMADRLPPVRATPSLQKRKKAIRHVNRHLIPPDVGPKERIEALFNFAAGSIHRSRLKEILSKFNEVGDIDDEWLVQMQEIFEEDILTTVVRAAYPEYVDTDAVDDREDE